MIRNTATAAGESGEGGGEHSSVSAAPGENFHDDAADAAWPREQRALLRGLAHALSNRVGTIVAASGLLEPGAPAPAPIVAMLRDEAERLEALLALVRQLAGESDAEAPEPAHLPDLVAPAVALHAQHPDWRDVPVEVALDAGVPPVRAAPDALLRTLLVLLSRAKAEVPNGVRITATTDGAEVVVTVGRAGVRLARL